MIHALRTLLTTTAAVLALAPAAGAALPAPVWLDAEPTGPAGAASSGQGLTGGATPIGGAWMAWNTSEGGHSRPVVNYRRPGGAWGTPVPLGPDGVQVWFSDSTATPDGTLTLVYATAEGRVYTRTISPAGEFGEPALLSDPNRSSGCGTAITAPDGTSYVAWCASETYLRVRPAGSSQWGDPVAISEPNTNGPTLARNGAGDLLLLYRVTAQNQLRARVLPAGSSDWSDPETLGGTPDSFGSLQVTADGDGRFVVVWGEQTTGDATIYGQIHAQDGWHPRETLVGSGGVAATVKTDGDGDVAVLVMTTDGMTYGTWSSELPRGEWSFGTLESRDPAGEMTGMTGIAVRPDGSMFGSMLHGSGMGSLGFGTISRPAGGGAWASPVDIDTGGPMSLGDSSTVAADGQGNLVLFWESADGTPMHAAGDAAGPEISGLAIPASAQTGEAVSLAVTATDTWSDVDTVTWQLGDGRTRSGDSASATYDTAGTYTVRVTATDSVGHSTTVSRQLTVTAPPAADTPADAAPKPTTTPKQTLAPVIEARLAGRAITLNAKVTLKNGKRCSGTVKATTAFGGRSYKVTLRLATKAGACRATGTIKLKKTPSLRTKLRVTVSGGQVKTRALTTRRG